MLARYVTGEGARAYHHTAPISMIFALHAALGALLDEGLAASFARHQACGELGRTEERHRRPLQVVEQHRLIEERLLVVVRRPPVGRRQHFTRRLGIVRLVGIPERRRAQAPEHDDEHDGRTGQKMNGFHAEPTRSLHGVRSGEHSRSGKMKT